LAVISVLGLLLFLTDRGLKYFFLHSPHHFELGGDYLKLELATNPGIAFSLPVNLSWLIFLTVVILLVLVYFLIKFWQQQKIWPVLGLELVVVGAFSNLLDRLYQGQVIDYLSVKYFTVFNLADVMICIGVAILLINSFFKSKPK